MTRKPWPAWLCLLGLALHSMSVPWLPAIAAAEGGAGFVLSLCTSEGPKQVVVPLSDERPPSAPRQHACGHCNVCSGFHSAYALAPVQVAPGAPFMRGDGLSGARSASLPASAAPAGFEARGPPLRSV